MPLVTLGLGGGTCTTGTTSDTTSFAVTYGDLKERVGHYLFGMRSGWSTDQVSDITECVDDGMKRVYQAFNWSFFRPVGTLTTVDGTSEYSMPTGYESIETHMHYGAEQSECYPPIEQRSDSQLRKWRQEDDTEGRPLYFAVRTVEYDAAVGSLRQLILYPTPDDAYVLYARMTLRPVKPSTDDQYPVGAEIMSQLLIESCLGMAEQGYDEQKKVHEDLYQQMLPIAIREDLEASAPKQLGPDAPKTSVQRTINRALLMGDVTIDGVTM